ncbi:MAG: Gfo/Idh/MocA family oxidoreductase [Clostridia bacterium]|nr:Gfo/Idh/MocA family oxidoreductase [Clostridia bacterium]
MQKIRIAQIGTGHPHSTGAAETILKNPEMECVGFAKVTPDYIHPEHRYYLDPGQPYTRMREYTVEELLDMEGLDAVAIECEEEKSTEYAQMFADRGVHIFLDKPGTHGIASFDRLAETCREKNLVLKQAYMYRYNPLVQKAMEIVKSGALGEIYAVEGQMSLYYPESMCRWIGKHKGGMMYYLGCHMVDLVLQFMGSLPEEILPMNASTGQYGCESENYGFAVLKYPKGVSFVKTTCDETNGFNRRQLVVCGTKGTIEIKPMEIPCAGGLLKAAGSFTVNGKTEQVEAEPFDRYAAMMQDFVNHVLGRNENPCGYDYEKALFRAVMTACGWKE